jgi:uncharacterized membrane protein YtjA (UPF0391 family)
MNPLIRPLFIWPDERERMRSEADLSRDRADDLGPYRGLIPKCNFQRANLSVSVAYNTRTAPVMPALLPQGHPGAPVRGGARPLGGIMPAGNLLYYALVALVISLVAAFLGFGGIAGTAAGIAQTLFYVFLVIFLVVLVLNFMGRGRGPVP